MTETAGIPKGLGDRIRQIEIFPLSLSLRDPVHSSKMYLDRRFTSLCVRIETEDGIVGWGEANGATSGAPWQVVQATVEHIAPLVLGSSVFQPEALRRRVAEALPPSNLHRLGNLALAGYDMACWDAVGHIVGRPVNELMGGRVRDSVNYFGYCLQTEVEPLVEEALAAVKEGFHVIYFKVGLGNERDLKAVAAVREAVGPAIAIRVDANEDWTPTNAFMMLQRLERYDLDFVEAPIDARNLTKMRELRQRTRVPIAGNEGMWSISEVSTAIELQACDVITTGPQWLGGLLPLYQVGILCAASGIGLCLHRRRRRASRRLRRCRSWQLCRALSTATRPTTPISSTIRSADSDAFGREISRFRPDRDWASSWTRTSSAPPRDRPAHIQQARRYVRPSLGPAPDVLRDGIDAETIDLSDGVSPHRLARSQAHTGS